MQQRCAEILSKASTHPCRDVVPKQYQSNDGCAGNPRASSHRVCYDSSSPPTCTKVSCRHPTSSSWCGRWPAGAPPSRLPTRWRWAHRTSKLRVSLARRGMLSGGYSRKAVGRTAEESGSQKGSSGEESLVQKAISFAVILAKRWGTGCLRWAWATDVVVVGGGCLY